MENRRKPMQESLSESLRGLMLECPFEKITIKQICDRSGVIRATFYNYYEDKYDCLNAIIHHDLVDATEPIANDPAQTGAVQVVLEAIDRHRPFYRCAYKVIGQNGFEEMLKENIATIFLNTFASKRKKGFLPEYSNELLASYYAECSAFVIRKFVFEKEEAGTVEKATKMIVHMTRTSFLDFIQIEEN